MSESDDTIKLLAEIRERVRKLPGSVYSIGGHPAISKGYAELFYDFIHREGSPLYVRKSKNVPQHFLAQGNFVAKFMESFFAPIYQLQEDIRKLIEMVSANSPGLVSHALCRGRLRCDRHEFSWCVCEVNRGEEPVYCAGCRRLNGTEDAI